MGDPPCGAGAGARRELLVPLVLVADLLVLRVPVLRSFVLRLFVPGFLVRRPEPGSGRECDGLASGPGCSEDPEVGDRVGQVLLAERADLGPAARVPQLDVVE